ncbi:MAG TPA: ATP-binding protein [Acidimicrobiales bacterium]|nr:ATP-binding protein [Acidimicrobiales bacterium]
MAPAPTPVRRGSTHLVDFFADDEALIVRVACHLERGLVEGGTAIAICTPGHRRALGRALAATGWNVEAAELSGSLVLLDARQTLAALTVDGHPDAAAYEATLGHLVRARSVPVRPCRMFDEMVTVLWADGRVNEAIELEELWNNLLAETSADLYCAYSSELLGDCAHAADVARVCQLHSSVLGQRPLGGSVGETAACRTFPPDVGSVPMARRFAQEVVAGHHHDLVAEVALVTTELAGNAVVHGRSEFDVTVTASSRRIRITVADGGHGRPVLRRTGTRSTAGRGLVLVRSVAARWGVESCGSGKVVWAEFDLGWPPPLPRPLD